MKTATKKEESKEPKVARTGTLGRVALAAAFVVPTLLSFRVSELHAGGSPGSTDTAPTPPANWW